MFTLRPFRWARRNLLLIVTAAVVMCSLLGTGALVFSAADDEDALREAETAAAELGPTVFGLSAQVHDVVSRGSLGATDLATNGGIDRRAGAAAERLQELWPHPAAIAVEMQTARVAAMSYRSLELIGEGRVPAARRLASRRLNPATAGLNRSIDLTRAELHHEVATTRRSAQLGSLAITGGVGILLVAVMIGVSIARRRNVGAEAEERALRHSERRLNALVRHGSDMITVLSPEMTILYEAGAVRAMLGYEPEELEGTRLAEWLHPDDAPVLSSLAAGANGGGPARELRLRHRDGSLRTCEARATSLLGDDLWNGIVVNIWDVSERKALEERLRHQAFHDGLTGLANRVLFGDRLEHALVRGARAQSPVTVFLIDLDDFKSVNDSLGHAAGDRLLGEIARRIGETMRAADTIARLGGDEFAVIVEDSGSEGDDRRAVERILAAVAQPAELEGRVLPVTASVGVARSVPGLTSAEQLVRDADLAMYAAKGEGKGRWTAFRPEMHLATEERLQLKSDLAQAVRAGDQFELFYQPLVALDAGSVVGLEALLRWNHPTRGRLQPEEFVPLAEETGAIVPIGRWVLEESCRQGRAWVDSSGKGLLISVNVSARQLNSPGLAQDVRAALARSGLPAERLVLEVTETELMRHVERAIGVLAEIRELGVRVAIDDFGTGYSSLSQLERLPVDILKVDREFAGAPRDPGEHSKLLRAVMEIGDSLHMATVAEGIETPAQLEELRGLHYPLGQGFLFSQPVPATEIDVLLAEQGSRVTGEPPADGSTNPVSPATKSPSEANRRNREQHVR
jgi:diguanylate cyclase (GGDEF)-like protein/PAS domain S-box-containing protein